MTHKHGLIISQQAYCQKHKLTAGLLINVKSTRKKPNPGQAVSKAGQRSKNHVKLNTEKE